MISRQNRILGYIRTHSKVATRDILAFFKKEEEHISRATILRDIKELLHEKLIKKNGKGRGVYYEEYMSNRSKLSINIYFAK